MGITASALMSRWKASTPPGRAKNAGSSAHTRARPTLDSEERETPRRDCMIASTRAIASLQRMSTMSEWECMTYMDRVCLSLSIRARVTTSTKCIDCRYRRPRIRQSHALSPLPCSDIARSRFRIPLRVLLLSVSAQTALTPRRAGCARGE